MLGSGAPELRGRCSGTWPATTRDKMAAFLRYDAALAPLIYARQRPLPDAVAVRAVRPGPDDRDALRLGAGRPATGGLADTVHDGVTGFSFVDYTPDALWQALARAVSTWWHDREQLPADAAARHGRRTSRGPHRRAATNSCSSGRFRESAAGDGVQGRLCTAGRRTKKEGRRSEGRRTIRTRASARDRPCETRRRRRCRR